MNGMCNKRESLEASLPHTSSYGAGFGAAEKTNLRMLLYSKLKPPWSKTTRGMVMEFVYSLCAIYYSPGVKVDAKPFSIKSGTR